VTVAEGKTKYLGDLLRTVRGRTQLSIPAMAEKLGIDKNTLGGYEREERLPDFEFLAKFSKLTGHDIQKLIEARMRASEHAPAFQAALRSISSATRAVESFWARRSGVDRATLGDMQTAAFNEGLDLDALEDRYGAMYPVPANVLKQPRPGYVYLPLKEVEAAAGAGSLIDGERVVDVLAFKEEWIRQELHARPVDLDLIYVKGDSMEPDLRAGDIILLDHTDTMARREGVYVIRMDGAVLVKQLQRLPGGVVKVISRNPAYEPFTVTVASIEDPNGFAVIGRVVWACRRF